MYSLATSDFVPMGYFRTVKVQANLYELRFINSDTVVKQDHDTPARSFTSRKEAREWLKENWQNIRQYN